MEKKLKKMEGTLEQHLTDRFYGTSLHDTKINYQYKSQERSSGTSIFYSADSVLGDARKLTLENYNLPLSQFQKKLPILTKLGLNEKKVDEAFKLMKGFMENSLEDTIYLLEKTVHETN